MINTNMIDNATVRKNGQRVDIIFNISDADYKLNFMLIWMISLAFKTDDVYCINSVYNDDKTVTMQHDRFSVDYILDKDDTQFGNLCFQFKTDDVETAKHMLNKVFIMSVTKANFRTAETHLTNMIYNRILASVNSKYSTDKLVYQYNDYIVSRQTLIKLYTLLDFDAPEHKAQMYISHNDLDTVRFSHIYKYKIALKHMLKAV